MTSSSLNIVFFAPNTLGGVRTYLLNLSFNLNLSKIDHTVVFYGNINLKLENDNKSTCIIGFDEYDSYKYKLKKLRRFIGPNTIIVANDRTEVDMCKYYKLQNPLVYIMHGDLYHYVNILNEKIIDKKLYVSDQLKNKYSTIESQKTVIYPTLPLAKIQKKRMIKQKPRLKMAFVGRLEYEKGADEISKLDKILDIEWGFFITKSNSDMMYINHVVSKTIYFDLANTELLNNLIDFDFLLFPSRSEGFGIAVLEAMYLGLVPIVRDLEMGIMQYLTHNINSIKFKDIEDVKCDIEELKINKIKFNSVVNAGLELVSEKFDNRMIVKHFLGNINNFQIDRKCEFEKVEMGFSFWTPNWLYRKIKKRIAIW